MDSHIKNPSNMCTYRDIKERVNAINFAEELESMYFDGPCQNGAFDVLNTPIAN